MGKEKRLTEKEPCVSAKGQKRLLFYAQIFHDLSDYYGEKQEIECYDSRTSLWQDEAARTQNKMMEGQLKSISRILANIAEEAYYPAAGYEKCQKRLFRKLTENDLEVDEINISFHQSTRLQVEICCHAKDDDYFSTRELAQYVSSIVHKTLIPDSDCPAYIHHKKECIMLREELLFQYYIGKATATKEGEVVSGDCFFYSDYADGRSLLALADGMGSGECAGEDAAYVLELLDKFLEAGLSPKGAMRQVNDILCMRCHKLRTVSVDLAVIDLFTGKLILQKSGASPLFVKNGNHVDKIARESLPLGILPGSYGEDAQVMLSGGEQLIFVSDGVLEALGDESGDLLSSALTKRKERDPKKLAAEILTMATMTSGGHILDDMTVVVVNVCKQV